MTRMKTSTIIFVTILIGGALASLAIVWYYTGNSTLFLGMVAIMCVIMWIWYDPQYDPKERLESEYQLRKWREMIEEMGGINSAGAPQELILHFERKLEKLEDRLSELESQIKNDSSFMNTNPFLDYNIASTNDVDILNLSSVLCTTLSKWDTYDTNKRAMLIFQLEKLSNNSLLLKETISILKNA